MAELIRGELFPLFTPQEIEKVFRGSTDRERRQKCGNVFEDHVRVLLQYNEFVRHANPIGVSLNPGHPGGRSFGAEAGMPDFLVTLYNGFTFWLEAKFDSYGFGNALIEPSRHKKYDEFSKSTGHEMFYISSATNDREGPWIYPWSYVETHAKENIINGSYGAQYTNTLFCKNYLECLEELNSK